MASCQNCKALLVTLKSQLHELHQQQKHLHAWNEELMNEINREKTEDQQSLFWKQKYEAQKQLNEEIEQKIKARNKDRQSFQSQRNRSGVGYREQKEQQILTARTTKKENQRSKSIRKMSELMKVIVLEKVDHQAKYSKQKSGRKNPKRELVLRIVDQRLNRIA